MGDEAEFLHADKHKSFLQVVSITLGCMAKYAESSQNNKFAICLQYLIENVKKVSSNCYNNFRYVWPDMPKIPKITSLLFLCNIL